MMLSSLLLLLRLRELPQVSHMLAESLPEGGRIVVGYAMLFAYFSDVWLQLAKMHMVHRGEQMVLRLKIQATSEQKDQIVV